MKLRDAIYLMSSLSVLCAFPSLCRGAERPNVIIVLTDDQGYGQWGTVARGLCANDIGNRVIPDRYQAPLGNTMQAAADAMPNLDRLAGIGLFFNHAYVASPVCGPSRAALMTGRHPARLGVYYNPDISKVGLDVSETVLAEPLRAGGYRTAMIGKWHLGEEVKTVIRDDTHDYHEFLHVDIVPEFHPCKRGFDYFYGFYSHGASYYNSPSIFRNYENVSAPGYLTDNLTEEALGFIRKQDDRPFFIYLAYNAPHIPLEAPPPARYLSRFKTGNPEVNNYYGALAAVDDGLARLEAELKSCGEWENTLIVYLSDNGAVIDSPQPVNGAYRGNKGVFVEGGVHTPMVFSWPAGLTGGRVVEEPVSSLDLFPTVLSAAGVKTPGYLVLDGVDLLPFLRGEVDDAPHDELFWAGAIDYHWSKDEIPFWAEYWRYLKMEIDERPPSGISAKAGWAVRTRDWSLHCTFDEGSPVYALYSLNEDPAERHDLSGSNPEALQMLMKKYQQWRRCMAVPKRWDRRKWDLLK